MKDILSHLFIPQESNNHRAKVLHHKNIFIFVVAFLIFQILFTQFKNTYPQVLGTTTDISPTKLLYFTNIERAKNNLNPLTLNSQLSSAAENKAKDMFLENYWAHFSPTGVTPWTFIKASGYNYVYAGENLARGFSDANSIVQAWMNSPSHRENQLSQNYTDVGYAVEDGKLLGEQTTLVVEMFGATPQSLAASKAKNTNSKAEALGTPNSIKPITGSSLLGATIKKPALNSSFTSRMVIFFLLSFFLLLFVLDAIFISKRKIVRIIGNHLDHTLFFCLIIVFVVLYSSGVIL